jgi:hypothetical protein
MKKNILFLVLLCFRIGSAVASHAIGGEITYKCLGADQYQITFKFYRDCSGIPAPATMDIVIENTCGYSVPSLVLSPSPSSPVEISPVCAGTMTTCNGGSFTGIEEWVYSALVTLPGPCSDWTFWHSESARNASLSTIAGSGSDNLFIYSVMNNMNGICDDSPTFVNKPVPLACVGQVFCFNNGVYDVQGDSLVYELIIPRTGPAASDTVSYISGYSYLQPLISSPPMTLNPVTGEICMNPQQSDVTPIAILVSSYRNGLLISQVERDIQLTILGCTNSLPVPLGFDGTGNFSDTVCVNRQNCFLLTAIDADGSNTTHLSWDNSILNMTANFSGGYRDTAFFCWSPVFADTSQNPRYFTLTATDDNCPYYGFRIATYTLYIDTSPNCISTGLGEVSPKDARWVVYPQPAAGSLFIDLGKLEAWWDGYTLRMMDIAGKSIFTKSIVEPLFSLDVKDLNGVYTLVLTDREGRVAGRKQILITN